MSLNKTVLIGLGGIISIAALFVVFSNVSVDATLSSEPFAQEQTADTPRDDNSELSINYVSKETPKEIVPKKSNEKKKIEREKYLESKTYDKSKKFEIALINKNQDLSKTTRGFTTLQGTIEGKSFFLKVPKHLIEEGSGVTKLRVTNLQTKEVATVSAAFIDDMQNPKIKQKIDIASLDDIENFTQTQVEAIVPPRPGEHIN